MSEVSLSKSSLLPVNAILSVLSSADGSVEIEDGLSKVLCSVMGPGDAPSSKRNYTEAFIACDFYQLPVCKNVTRASTEQSQQHRRLAHPFIESVINGAIDVAQYPRAMFHVCVQELVVADGGPIAALLLNGLCLALLDAGIRLRHVFAAVSVCFDDAEGVEMYEPVDDELHPARAQFIFVFRPSPYTGGHLLATHATGPFSLNEYETALGLAKTRCLCVFDFFREKMQQKFLLKSNLL